MFAHGWRADHYGSSRARLVPLEIYDQPLGGPKCFGDGEWRSPSPLLVVEGRLCRGGALPGGRAVCAGRAVVAQVYGVPAPGVPVRDARCAV